MGVLLADGGATSVDWAYLEKGKPVDYFTGLSLSPIYVNEEEGLVRLHKTFAARGEAFAHTIREVYFYGASCGPDQPGRVVRKSLQRYFSQASVHVASDMEAAALALFGWGGQGVVGIVGTGSNACYYDGHTVHYARPSLGYVLGDEGSGAYIGKRVLRDWLYGLLPPALEQAYEQAYGEAWGVRKGSNGVYLTEQVVLRVMQGGESSAFLSAFARILLENLDESYAERVLRESFASYIDLLVLPHVTLGSSHRVGYAGSVAWYGRTILEEESARRGLRVEGIERAPLPSVVKGFLQRGK